MMPNCDSCRSLFASEVNNNNIHVVIELFSTLINHTHWYNIKLMKKKELLFLPFQKFLSPYSKVHAICIVISWNVTLCSLLYRCRHKRFGGTCFLHLRERRRMEVSLARCCTSSRLWCDFAERINLHSQDTRMWVLKFCGFTLRRCLLVLWDFILRHSNVTVFNIYLKRLCVSSAII